MYINEIEESRIFIILTNISIMILFMYYIKIVYFLFMIFVNKSY